MTRWIAMMAAVVVCAWPLSSLVAQKQSVAPRQTAQQVSGQQTVKRETAEIVPGQSLDEVAAILRQHGKEFGGPWFSFARQGAGAEEIQHMGVTLDAEHTAAAIFYQIGSQRVTSIAINLKPLKSSPKGDQFWMSARKITLHPDESFSIHFEKPTPPKPAAERPKSVYPTDSRFGGNGQVPANPIRSDGRY